MTDAVGFRDVQYINVQDNFNAENENGDKECSICLEKLKLADTVRELGCKHIFHKDCVKEQDNCPICRKPITSRNITPTNAVDLPVRPQDYMPAPSAPPVSISRENHFTFGTTTRPTMPSVFSSLADSSTRVEEGSFSRGPERVSSRRSTFQRAARNSTYHRDDAFSEETRGSPAQQPSEDDRNFAREIKSKYETLRKEHDRGLTEAEKKAHEESNRTKVLEGRETIELDTPFLVQKFYEYKEALERLKNSTERCYFLDSLNRKERFEVLAILRCSNLSNEQSKKVTQDYVSNMYIANALGKAFSWVFNSVVSVFSFIFNWVKGLFSRAS